VIINPVDQLYASAATPDEKVTARLEGRSEVTVRLAPGYFHRASASDLEFQLTRLAKLLFVARMREYYRARSVAFDMDVRGEAPPTTEADRDFVEARGELVAEGGTGSVVELTCVGMEHWSVRVDPDELARLDEAGFCRAVSRAASELVADQMLKARALKNAIYVGRVS
jgi:hypothetical protein